MIELPFSHFFKNQNKSIHIELSYLYSIFLDIVWEILLFGITRTPIKQVEDSYRKLTNNSSAFQKVVNMKLDKNRVITFMFCRHIFTINALLRMNRIKRKRHNEKSIFI